MELEAVIDSRPGTSDVVTRSPLAVSSTDERGHTVLPRQRSSSWTVSESAKAGVVPSASHSPTNTRIHRTPGQYPVDNVLVLRTCDQFQRVAEREPGDARAHVCGGHQRVVLHGAAERVEVQVGAEADALDADREKLFGGRACGTAGHADGLGATATTISAITSRSGGYGGEEDVGESREAPDGVPNPTGSRVGRRTRRAAMVGHVGVPYGPWLLAAEGAVGGAVRPRPSTISSICLWPRRSQSSVPGSGRESSDAATMRSSGVRSARSSPAVWPRSIKLRRAVRTSAWRWRVAGVKTFGPPCRGSTKRSRSRRVARKNSRIPSSADPERAAAARALSTASPNERCTSAPSRSSRVGK